jgi:hypothetical protein
MPKEFSIFKEEIAPLKIPQGFRSFDRFNDFQILTRRTIKVLVVVDTSVQFREAGDFGVGRFVKLLRETTLGCTRFQVDIAVRPFVSSPADISFEENPSPTPAAPHRYMDFRFDSQIAGQLVLNRYHEVFLFGFAPDNNAATDANISAHPWFATNNELSVLHDWMNNGGGVFATGDHDYLGASMCSRIPRVGTMRKWTNADGVPPFTGPTRLDTNRPATTAQQNGMAIIPDTVERDALPQEIEWIPEQVIRTGLRVWRRPHPILCHPTHGPINVMPDHPHEGCCVLPSAINFAAPIKFGTAPEYPTHGTVQPKPKIIAYGNVLGLQNHAKGPVNVTRFPMISVYDGRENNTSNVGRVVVDSTWHHWFNMNLEGLESAVDKTNWEKISRYFVNIATWIAPRNVYSRYCWWEVLVLHFEYPGIREINPKTPIFEAGIVTRNFLYKKYGACWVYQLIVHNLCRVYPKLCQLYEKLHDPIREFDPPGHVCLTCPPFDVIEALILGYIHKSFEPIADKIKFSFSTKRKGSALNVSVSELEETALDAVAQAVKQIQKMVKQGQDTVSDTFSQPVKKPSVKQKGKN